MADAAYHPLVKAVARALRQRCGVGEGAGILVAVSGGADSVALLHALAHLAKRRRWRLRLNVGHVDHGLREAGAQDAAFVRESARRLKLPFAERRLDMAADTANLEAEARRLRYEALGELAGACDANFVATAHHADDQLETLLMAILRGTSVRGLRGIAWQRPLKPQASSLKPLLIRPMLGATHEQAIDYLRAVDQPWREDHTNADLGRTRARLRHEVLPVLRSLRPAAAHKAMQLAEHARQVVRRLEEPGRDPVDD